jgi:hypothetical protein
MEDFPSTFLPFGTFVNDTHFYQRDRMGRALAFAARTGKTVIAANESTALIKKPEMNAYIAQTADPEETTGREFIYEISGGNPTSPGQPLSGTFTITRKSKFAAPFTYTLIIDANF